MNDIIDIIKSEYPKVGYSKTAKKLNISVFRLKNIIKNNNIVLGDRIRKVSMDNFQNITKKEVAYFLGFFWSDGYISRDEITIQVKKEDGLVIHSILNKFGEWKLVERLKKQNNKYYEQSNIRINDKYIKKFLFDNDFDKKSLLAPNKILNIIPDELKNYFFRGLIDGDGCFCSKNRNYFSITGNINQEWNHIEDLFSKLNIKYSLNRKERNTGCSSYIVISSKIDIIKLGNYLYGDNFDGIGLKRKYDIYNEIKNKPTLKLKPIKEYNRYYKLIIE
jgi:hypothetical protein